MYRHDTIPQGLIFTEEQFLKMDSSLQLSAVYKTTCYLVDAVSELREKTTHVCPFGEAIKKEVEKKNIRRKLFDNLYSVVGGIIGGSGAMAVYLKWFIHVAEKK